MEAKQTALENAMRKIEKDFGKGAIMRLGDIADKMNLEVISSGSLAVDLAIGGLLWGLLLVLNNDKVEKRTKHRYCSDSI